MLYNDHGMGGSLYGFIVRKHGDNWLATGELTYEGVAN